MSRNLIAELQRRALTYLVIAVLLIVIGIQLRVGNVCFYTLFILVTTFFFLSRSAGNLIRARGLNREQLDDFRRAFSQQFSTQNLPRQIFWLLFAVAEADGKTEAEERELVRRFLLERFTDPATAADLGEWEAIRIPPEQVGGLALNIARVLSPSERETVFTWCCLVAFADNKYDTEEHIVLQQIARSFGFEGHHARRIFHYAKTVHLGGGQERRAPGAQGPVSNRRHALEVLGLHEGANSQEIKKRHRELAREFHPDKHQHLGEVAAQEAEVRFREVQSAYEVLVG